MARQILRKIDGWRFELPLALALGCAAGFAAIVMPDDLLARIPLLGAMGLAGRAVIALGLGIVCGFTGYAVMRQPASAGEAEAEWDETAEAVIVPPPLPEQLPHRVRRADAHPDAPPRAPIHASRDLGEPFMAVNSFSWQQDNVADEAPAGEPAPVPVIPEAEFVELHHETVTIAEPPAPPEAPESAPEFAEVWPVHAASLTQAEVGAMVLERPAVARPAVRGERQSLEMMIERLSAGLERRADRAAHPEEGPVPQPARDMRPAMREALEELNRLAKRRD